MIIESNIRKLLLSSILIIFIVTFFSVTFLEITESAPKEAVNEFFETMGQEKITDFTPYTITYIIKHGIEYTVEQGLNDDESVKAGFIIWKSASILLWVIPITAFLAIIGVLFDKKKLINKMLLILSLIIYICILPVSIFIFKLDDLRNGLGAYILILLPIIYGIANHNLKVDQEQDMLSY